MAELDGALYAPSLVEVTTRRLRAEILSGELAPGQRLVEEQIRQRFAISRAPLREALRTLANQGLVEHLPRRGTRVTELSERDIDELFDLRSLLERHAVELRVPAELRSPGEIAWPRCAATWTRCAAPMTTGDELAKDDAHRAFHAAVVALAGNRQLDLALEPILLQLQRPMAANLRREAAPLGHGRPGSTGTSACSPRWRPTTSPPCCDALEEHGARRFLGRRADAPHERSPSVAV